MAKLSTVEKIAEAREQAKRGREKGYTHSAKSKETREKMKRSAEERWRRERGELPILLQ